MNLQAPLVDRHGFCLWLIVCGIPVLVFKELLRRLSEEKRNNLKKIIKTRTSILPQNPDKYVKLFSAPCFIAFIEGHTEAY